MTCKKCGCVMVRAMKGVGLQRWVCTNPECHYIEVEK